MTEPTLNRPWIAELRSKSPLVHHLTNLVTINDCANVTLCFGASPVMSDAVDEADQLTALASALVINMGTPNEVQVEAMVRAGRAARDRGLTIVFDPVGAGATPYRQAVAARILDEVGPTVIKGNLAEIKFLGGLSTAQRGVDSLDAGSDAPAAVTTLARARNCVVAATGAVDHVGDGTSVWSVTGGRPELGRVTGTGCMSASLVASLAAAGADPVTASLLGIVAMNRAGETAGGLFEKGLGMGSFRIGLFDALSLMTDANLKATERIARVR